MSEFEVRFQQTVAAMRQEFDRAFAEPAQPPASDREAFLAIQVAGRPFALRIAELSRLEPARRIVSLPGGASGLLGLAGIQGRLTPVYRLAAVLGLGAVAGEGRWIAVHGREEPLGLAFEEFEGFVQAALEDILPGEGGRAVRGAGAVRPVIQLPAILAAIRERLGPSR